VAAIDEAGRPELEEDGIQFSVPGWTVNEISSIPWPLTAVRSQSCGRDRRG